MADIEKLKHIYLVRHGQSVDNALPVFQSPESELSEKGKQQAEFIAHRASNLEFELLLSSPLARTKATAEAISRKTGKDILFSDLFVERMKPSSINGKPFDDEEASRVWKEWEASMYTSGSKVQDGENYDEIIVRADAALDFLLKREEKKILVVTHAFFLRSMIARVVLGSTMTPASFQYFLQHTRAKNTGLSVIEFVQRDGNETYWRLQTHNDHSHLG